MTKLSDTQLLILSAAAQRDDGNLLPLPGSLRGGAAAKVVGALLSRGLIAESVTEQQTKADAALNRVWRNEDDGRAVLLHITDGRARRDRRRDRARRRRAADSAPEGATEAARAGDAGTDAADRRHRRRPRPAGRATAPSRRS